MPTLLCLTVGKKVGKWSNSRIALVKFVLIFRKVDLF